MQPVQALVVLFLCGTISANLCTYDNILTAARVVHGESRGESYTGQLAVAWTIVNRLNHTGYPNTLNDVVYAKYGNLHEYNTLDLQGHNNAWETAKATNNYEYKNAIGAASGALCNTTADPTKCAVSFCALDPCPATASNTWWVAYCDPSFKTCPQKIGNHYFVCRKPVNS